jgi:hypothetical protein
VQTALAVPEFAAHIFTEVDDRELDAAVAGDDSGV